MYYSMKLIRRVCFSFLLAFALCARLLTVPVLADTVKADNSITIYTSATGHTYEAYQIFKGDVARDDSGNKILSNIQWGSGVALTASLPDAKTAAGQIGVTSNAVDATTPMKGQLKTLVDSLSLTTHKDSQGLVTLEDGKTAYVISGLEDGYYLIKDKDGSLDQTYDAYTSYLIKVVGQVTSKPKSALPHAEKKVKDQNDTAPSSEESWQDSADYDIGDAVPFMLTAHVADNYGDYAAYTLIFHDQMSEGLTLNKESFVVKIGQQTLSASDYSLKSQNLKPATDTFQLELTDLKTIAGKYNISIDASTPITVAYQALLNEKAHIGNAGNPNIMYLEYSNNPEQTILSEEGPSYGKTPEDRTIVFTYQLVISKVDGQKQPLKGAMFSLAKVNQDGSQVIKEWDAKVLEDETTFTFAGLDDGQYVLKEIKTPAGYNTIAPVSFTIEASHSEDASTPELISLNGNAQDGSILLQASLREGSLSADVVNTKGMLFPETGGRGRALFYLFGISLMAVAAMFFLLTGKKSEE